MNSTITTSDLIEYLYCPRFIYFIYCLCIPQYEEKRYKVQKGRNIHKIRGETNKSYLRKKLDVVDKEIEVPLNSEKHHIHGIVDEVLTLSDDTMAPLDYKFAEYKEKLFTTYKYQSFVYALLIKENYGKEVNKGFICYARSNYLIKKIEYTAKGFNEVENNICEILKIIQTGYFPKKTKYASRCIDCCYKNICIK
ncbi:MAG: CRISPR-associated protein Cas4 [Cyanobacteriota bacterium]